MIGFRWPITREPPSAPSCTACAHREQSSRYSIQVETSPAVAKRLQKLAAEGLHGQTPAEVAERLICAGLVGMER
jgi:hypothetical protein